MVYSVTFIQKIFMSNPLPVIPDVRSRLAKKNLYSRSSANYGITRQSLADSSNCSSLSSYKDVSELPPLHVKTASVGLDIHPIEKKPRRSSYSQKICKKSNPLKDELNIANASFIKKAKKTIKTYYKNNSRFQEEEENDSFIEVPGLPPQRTPSKVLSVIESETSLGLFDLPIDNC